MIAAPNWNDGHLVVWDAKSGLVIFKGPNYPHQSSHPGVYQVIFTPDSKGLVQAFDTGLVETLSTETWKAVATANLDQSVFGVNSLGFAGITPDGSTILADPGLMRYAVERHPALRLHLSVQGSATTYEAINFYVRHFGIRRAVLPRVLSLAQVEQVVENAETEIEVFGFGSLCVMVEGRCALSSYTTGEGPNTVGVCSPAKAVRWQPTAQGLEVRLAGVLIDRFADGEHAGYPTLCKGRYAVGDETYYAIEEPTSLNTLELLPDLIRMGIAAVKIEGRQRSPAYVAAVTRIWRAAIDACLADPARFVPRPEWQTGLAALSEGRQTTLGAYHRPWK